MQLGFVNFNTEEKKRVAKMMQLLQESEAIEELGIGRVRDHFSNTLFPGTSTLQHHAKYFVVLPSLYYHAGHCDKRFTQRSEVERYIKEAEIQITRQLAEDENGNLRENLTGITGINTYKDALTDYRKYVKYDPAYIYGSGLATYGMIPNTDILGLVLELNKSHHNDPYNKSMRSDDNQTEDDHEHSGTKQVIKTCEEKYDFCNGKTMNLALTKKEAEFLKGRITQSCGETMLSYFLTTDSEIPDKTHYFELEALLKEANPNVIGTYNMSILFSKLMHLVDWRFNYAYFDSFGNTDEATKCEKEYADLLSIYNKDITREETFASLFDYIMPIDSMLTDFCKNCYKAIRENDTKRIDALVKSREQSVKRERSKIGNSAYKNQGRVKPQPNTFRWETVKIMINEIRNPE